MKRTNFSPNRIRTYSILVALGWTSIILLLMGFSTFRARQQILEIARTEARTSIAKDIAYRRWNASHGGVYVPITPETLPNPYLDIPNREVTTINGLELTLINPAYMTRQALEIGAPYYEIRGHLTSLYPIRPENAADSWETQALAHFEQGEPEFSSVEIIDGEEYLRLMKPFITEEPCLKCHSKQGYQVGDIRGGLSTSIPMDRYSGILQNTLISSAVGYTALWLLGLLSIYFITRDLNKRIQEREETEQKLRESEEKYRTLFEHLPIPVFTKDCNGKYTSSNTENLKFWDRNPIGHTDEELLPPGIAAALHRADLQVMETGKNLVVEEKLIHSQLGEHQFLSHKVPLRDANDTIIGILGTSLDITEHRQIEDALRQERDRAQGYLDTVETIIVALDAEGRITTINRKGCEILGYAEGELRGQFWFSKCLPEPEGLANVYPFYLQLMEGKLETGEYFENPIITRDGELRQIAWHNALLFDERGQISGTLSSGDDITERKLAEAKLAQQFEYLRALHKIDQVIAANLGLKETLDFFVEEVASQLEVDAVSILLLDEQKRLNFAAGYGFTHPDSLEYARLPWGEGLAGLAVSEWQIVHLEGDLAKNVRHPALALVIQEEGFMAYYGIPLIAKDQMQGVLEVFHRQSLATNSEWLNFIETLGGQAAIAIDNATLFDDLQQSNKELTLAYDATLEGWSHALDLRDRDTEGHTRRVTELSIHLARNLGFAKDELLHLRRGALLHDIGKMGIPDAILHKSGPLNEEEWNIMRKHPQYAYEMLLQIQYLHPALDIPRCHHERWDGTGYPDGLKGEEIPLAARIFSVVDYWDALTSDRPYRKAWSAEKTKNYLKEMSGQIFDPSIVESFLAVIEKP